MYIQAWKKKDFVHLAIPKNGLVTYGNFLKDHGWRYMDVYEVIRDSEQYTFWANIRNPHKRHTKGLAEFLTRMFYRHGKDVEEVSEYLINLLDENEQILKYWVLSVTDQHTLPIYHLMEPFNGIDINWIPIDTCVKSEDVTNFFFEENGIKLKLEERDRANVSSKNKAALQVKINEVKEDLSFYKDFFTPFVIKKDIDIYNKAIDNWSKKLNNMEMLSYKV